MRVRFRVAALEIELLSEAGAEASCELARLNCERFDAEYNSWDGDTPHTTHNTTSSRALPSKCVRRCGPAGRR